MANRSTSYISRCRAARARRQRGNIDIGLVINPVANPDLVIKRLATDHFQVWRHAASPTREQIIYNPDLFQAQALLRKWKRRPSESLTTPSLDLIARLTAARIGYGILPARAVALSGEKLVRVANTPEFTDEICLVHRPEFGRTRYEKMIIECLKFD